MASEQDKGGIEEAAVSAYMLDGDAGREDAPEYKQYLVARYEEVKKEYRGLQYHRREAEELGNKELLTRVTGAFHENYRVRKWLVESLWGLNVDVGDKFVPKPANGKG